VIGPQCIEYPIAFATGITPDVPQPTEWQRLGKSSLTISKKSGLELGLGFSRGL